MDRGPPVKFTKDRPLHLIVGPGDSGICAISESRPELVVDGTVELHLAFAQQKRIERVSLTFSSTIFVRIREDGEKDMSDELKPCRDRKIQVWRIGAAFPPPGEHVLRFPFSFPLPANSPPSMREEVGSRLASIEYKLDLCGERNVTFGFDMHIERWVKVIPPSTLRPTGGRDLVRTGGVDISRSVFKRGKGHVEMTLSIPGHSHRLFPMDTKIPFTVTVSTFSVPVYATSDPETDKDALFPTIDVAMLHLLLRLGLKRYTTLRVRGLFSATEQTMSSHRALPNFQQKDKLNVDVGPKEWVACTGDQKLRGKGHWKQQFVFRSSMTLSSQLATSTFKHTLIDVSYALKLDCIIPTQKIFGADNRITIKLPIVIS